MMKIQIRKVQMPYLPLASRLLFALLYIVLMATCRDDQTENDKPNIVLIVADDLGYGDLSSYGATKIATPNIDQLATEGMRFTNAYVASSICSPSRYSLLTGEYSWRTRLKHSVLKYYDRPLIGKDQTTLASLLKGQGYHTACVGKWHLGFDWEVNEKAPQDPDSVFDSWDKNTLNYIDFTKPVRNGPITRGFDYFYGTAGSNNMQPYVYIENDKVIQAPSEEQKPYDHYINVLRAPNWDIRTVNEVLTHKAVNVINDHFSSGSNEPLFLYFPTTAIHRPCLPTFTKGKSQAGLRGDIVLELDWTVNKIVTALKENGVYENTLLIFTSDNGPRPGDPAVWLQTYAEGDYEDFHQEYFDEYQPEYIDPDGNAIWKNGWFTYGHPSAGPYLGFKSDAWDGAFRVPFIVRWPGKVSPGVVNGTTICLTDMLETFSALVGEDLHEGEGRDSYSFLPNMLDHKAPETRTSMTLAGGASGAFVSISGGWKYIEPSPPGRWPETYYPNGPSYKEFQLYNLNEDKSEQINLFDRMPGKVSELVSIIERVKEKGKTEGNANSLQAATRGR